METNIKRMIYKIIFLDFDGVITNGESSFKLNPDKLAPLITEQQPYLVLTDLWEGLTEKDVEKAIKLLKEA